MGPGGYPGKWHPLLCSDAASAARLRRSLLLGRALRCCVPTLRAQPVGRQAASDAPRSFLFSSKPRLRLLVQAIARCATFLPLTHGRPPTVRVPIAGAVASSGAAKGRLLYQRRLSVIFSRCAPVQGCHGGLTPPALVLRCERLPAKNDFCDARVRAHQTRAAGVSPPWAWVTHLQGRYRKRAGDRDRCVGKYPCSCDFATLQETTDTVRASVFAITAAGGASVVLRAIARWHCECACANPRGADAPRSCVARTHIVLEMRGCRFATRVSVSHGGLTPPLLCCGANVCRRKNDFCDGLTLIRKSGGRQPAVGVGKRTCNGASTNSR
jgi:hypothetical protein